MQLKDLISHGDLQIKTKIKSEGERFIVGFKLDLSKEELAMLGLGVPRKGRGKEVAKQPSLRETVDTLKETVETLKDSVETLRELVIKGFEQVNKRLDNIEYDVKVLKQDVAILKQDVALMKTTPTMAKELQDAIKSN